MLYSLSAMTSYGHVGLYLESRWANDGCVGGIEWNAPFRADDGILIRHDPKGLAHRKPGTGATLLSNVSGNPHRAEGLASQRTGEQTEKQRG